MSKTLLLSNLKNDMKENYHKSMNAGLLCCFVLACTHIFMLLLCAAADLKQEATVCLQRDGTQYLH